MTEDLLVLLLLVSLKTSDCQESFCRFRGRYDYTGVSFCTGLYVHIIVQSMNTTVLMPVNLVLYIVENLHSWYKFPENYLQFRTSHLILFPTTCNISATIPKMTSLSRPAASACSGCLKISSLTMKRTTRQSPYREGCWLTTAQRLTLLIHSHQR